MKNIDQFILGDDGCIIMISNNDIVTPLTNKEVVEILNDMIKRRDD